MTDLCACGIELPTEAAKQRHTTVCDLQGLPGCRVTVYNRGPIRNRQGMTWPRCGEPADDTGLCAVHRADKERLS